VTERPQSPLPEDPRQIPALDKLIVQERWCVWSWEWVDKHGEGKWSKPPRTPRGQFARNNDKVTWATLDECWSAVQAGKAEGVGFMLQGLPGEWLAAIDLDDVLNPVTKQLLPWAEELAERAGSYVEVTPSGAGLRILGYARGIGEMHRRIEHPEGGSFELYVAAARYITISGQAVGGDELADIGDIMRELEAIGDARPNGRDHDHDHDNEESDAEPISLEGLPLVVVELIVHGTLDGKPVQKRGPAFMRVVQALHRAGHSFGAVLATLRAYPDGIQSKYAGRLETELRRAWDKIDEPAVTTPHIHAGDDEDDDEENAPALSEEELALGFAGKHADDLRHVARWGDWLLWTGNCWRSDETLRTFTLARAFCRLVALALLAELGEDKAAGVARRIASAHCVAAVVTLARSDRRLAVPHEHFDGDSWLFNTEEDSE
jgi:putative DNA primase/helicase